MKIAHEAPKSIFKDIQKVTDYDYFLVHLFDEDKEYLKLAKSAVEKGREVILDNSIFELGEAFDMERFAYWVNELRPTWYIVPDALEDSKKTMENMKTWIIKYGVNINPACRMIGTVQGKTYEEIKECYQFMDVVAEVDKIAISFDYSYYLKVFPHENKWLSYMMGRINTLKRLEAEGVINTHRPHHLLGCALPQEFSFYNQKWIDSCDTSNPVVHGIKGISYNVNFGLLSKNTDKLFEMMKMDVTPQQKALIMYNISIFKELQTALQY